jgi:hypothetical protein
LAALPAQALATTASIRSGEPCAADRLHAGFRQAEVLDLAFLNQILHRPRHLFDWHVRVHTVLIEQIDDIGLESLECGIGHIFDVRRSAIHACLLPLGIKFEPELGGDHHLLADMRECFAHQVLVTNGPYASAVSKKVTPRSTAARINLIASCLSVAGP